MANPRKKELTVIHAVKLQKKTNKKKTYKEMQAISHEGKKKLKNLRDKASLHKLE